MLRAQDDPGNTVTRALGVALVVGLLVGAVLLATSCASMPADRVAYNSITGAVSGVQTALVVYGELLADGKVPADSRPKVEAAYIVFQRAALLASSIAQRATATKEEKAAALASVNAAASDLYAATRGAR